MLNSYKYAKRIDLNNPRTFEKIFREFNKPLILFAFKYLGDMNMSEDIVQEVFIDLWSSDNVNIKNDNSLKSYLFVIIKNKCLNYLRSEKVRVKNHDNLIYLQSDSIFEHNMIKEDLYSKMYEFINDLPEKQKGVIITSLNNISNYEISQELFISENTVKAHKKKSYRTLKEKLKKSYNFITLL